MMGVWSLVVGVGVGVKVGSGEVLEVSLSVIVNQAVCMQIDILVFVAFVGFFCLFKMIFCAGDDHRLLFCFI